MKDNRIASYSTNGIIVLFSGEWIFLNDDSINKLNLIIQKMARDKTKHRKRNSDGILEKSKTKNTRPTV